MTSFIIWIVTGIIAGWLAGMVMKGRGYGLIGDLVIGLLGGLLGGWLSGVVGFHLNGWIGDVLTSALGGIVLIVILRVIRRV